jgi:hypothetical protein
MEYTVTSLKKVCGKTNGDIITSEEIVNAGGNEKQLLKLSMIKEVTKAAKITPAVKEAPPVTQQEEVPVFNSVNNEQGEEPWQE